MIMMNKGNISCFRIFVSSRDIDIVALSETWLKGDPSDAQSIGEVSPRIPILPQALWEL